MNAEKQFQEVPSRTIQPKVKNDALEMPDNRQMSAMQAKMLETIQRQEDEEEPVQGKFTTQLQEDDDELAQGKFVSQLQGDDEEESMQGKFTAQLQEEDDELLQGKFATQMQEEDDELLQGKFTTQMQGEDEEELLQGKFVSQLHADTEPISAPGGEPAHDDKTGLPDDVRQGMEEAIGGNFSSVQFVTESKKAEEVGALAFTQGKNVEFAPGQFKPDTTAGLELIGHELTHVDQQDKGTVEPTMEIGEMLVNDDKSKETEADDKGKAAARLVEQKRNG